MRRQQTQAAETAPTSADSPDRAADPAGAGADPEASRPKKERYGKIARRGVAWSFVREGVTELITLPSALILARLLTPFDFGMAASAAVFITLATRLTNVGFNQALVRIKELRPEHSSSVFVVVLALGVTAFAIVGAAARVIASFFNAPELADVMWVAAICFLITPFGTVSGAMMTRDMRFRHTAFCDWAGRLAQASTGIVLALNGFGYWSLVYGQLAGDVVITLARIFLSRWRVSFRFSTAAIKELLSFGTGVFAKRLLEYAAGNLDSVVVGRLLGISALGFYDKGFTTVRRVLTRMNTGGPMVSFRVLSLIQEEPERFSNAYRRVVLGASLFCIPALLGLAALGPDLIPVAFGDRWEPTIVPFQILCVAGIFKVLTEYAGSAIQAIGKVWGQVGRQLVHAALVVVLVAGFSRFGLPGAAFGFLLAMVVMYLMMQSLLTRLTPVTVKMAFESELPGLVCGIAVGLVVWGTRSLALDFAPAAAQWVRLIAEATAGSLAYLAFIKFNRFRAVRRLVRDTATDLAPPFARVARLLA